MADLTAIDRLEIETRPYCVHIADGNGASLGSGLLYYPGAGDKLYVFTCAHVVDSAETLTLSILLPEKPEHDQYGLRQWTVSAEQIYYSPLDQTEKDAGGHLSHSHDVAVVAVQKEEELQLAPTEYFIAEAEHSMPIFAQGYPGGWNPGTEELLEALDRAVGTVRTAIAGKATFDFRVEDSFLDAGDRVHELKGFSGAPVWYADDSEHSVVGLMAAGKRPDVFRSVAKAANISFVRSMMKNRFGVHMETKIMGIPEKDVAEKSGLLDNTALLPEEDMDAAQNAWFSEQQMRLRALMDDLQMQEAIDLGRELMDDQRYQCCTKAQRQLLMKHLMYCYDTCILGEEAAALEARMRREGLIEEHDPKRWMTNLFGMQRYEELLEYAERIPETDTAYAWARFFKAMASAFVRKDPPEQTVGLYVDGKERLREPAKDADTEAFYLQVIGFVYNACYHMPEKAIRCLNRSYRVNTQPIVLETLAGAYYQLAIQPALDENNRIILDRIDRDSLYKARSCFLILMEKEDDLCFKGAIARMGWQIFHTFVFLRDNYRIIKLYPWMRDYFPFRNQEDRRDVEKAYADIIAQSGSIDLSQFSALTEEDKLLFQTAAAINRVAPKLGGRDVPPEMEPELKAAISWAEENVKQMSAGAALPIHRVLIFLYSEGIRLFGWDALAEMKRHYREIQASGNQKMIDEIADVIFEYEHSFEENIQHFQEAYRRAPSSRTWNALTGIYIRFGDLDTAEARYEDLMRNHEELYQGEPEYMYRAYLDFIREYRRDLKNALRCFLDGKDKFDDKTIADFWELELMLMTSTFNEPERFEKERHPFVKDGLIEPGVYYHNALAAYTANLNAPKAGEMFRHLTPQVDALTWDEAFYLAWQKQLRPVPDEHWDGMVPRKIDGILAQYRGEAWRGAAMRDKLVSRLRLERVCCLDAWALYLLAEGGQLEALEDMDRVYIPHCTIEHLLSEICAFPNIPVHLVLAYISAHDNMCIHSPDFEHQLKVRDKVRYDEPACVTALALEKDCPAVIGEPNMEEALVHAFPARVLRPTDAFYLK